MKPSRCNAASTCRPEKSGSFTVKGKPPRDPCPRSDPSVKAQGRDRSLPGCFAAPHRESSPATSSSSVTGSARKNNHPRPVRLQLGVSCGQTTRRDLSVNLLTDVCGVSRLPGKMRLDRWRVFDHRYSLGKSPSSGSCCAGGSDCSGELSLRGRQSAARALISGRLELSRKHFAKFFCPNRVTL